MNKHEIEIATEAGRAARRAGKGRGNNPFRYGSTTEMQTKADAWNEGWDEEDAERVGSMDATARAG